MTTINEDGGRLNLYAIEPTMYIDENSVPHNEKAERLNGRLAMLGVIHWRLSVKANWMLRMVGTDRVTGQDSSFLAFGN